MTIQKAIEVVSNCLKLGADAQMCKLALIGDGFAPERADTIILWAQQYNEKK